MSRLQRWVRAQLSGTAVARIAGDLRSWPPVLSAAIARRRDRSLRAEIATVRERLELPPLPHRATGVWAVTMVKDEADIIEQTVRHLFTQGVNGVLVSDNGSTDDTLAVLQRLAGELNVHIARDLEPAYYQASKMSVLADWARRAGAEWIVPFDADEFWFAEETTLADWLIGQPADVVSATMHNQFPDEQGGWRVDRTPHLYPKVAFRAHRLAWLGMGNHSVTRPGRRTGGLHVLHVPWRSYEQFARKTRNGQAALAASSLPDGAGSHWRDIGTQTDWTLQHLWEDLVAGRDDPSLGWSPVGPFLRADARSWQLWDPEKLLAAPEHRPDKPARDLQVVRVQPSRTDHGRSARLAARLARHTRHPLLAITPTGAPPADRHVLLVAARFADLEAVLSAGWRPTARDGAWVLQEAPRDSRPAFPGQLFVTPPAARSWPPASGTRQVPTGADVQGMPPVRRDPWVDVTGSPEVVEAVAPRSAGTGLHWRAMTERVRTQDEEQRSLWADLSRSKVAVVESLADAPWWPDAVACGTLLCASAEALEDSTGVPSQFTAAPVSLAEAVHQWSPDLCVRMRDWAREHLDWESRIDQVLGELDPRQADLR